jgi:hypothetical protein
MWFRLAKELGMSVRRAQEEISSAEFGEWVAYYSIEPFGDRMADLRAGTVASVVANANRSKDAPAFVPGDFVPWAKEPEPETPKQPSAEEVAAAVFGVNLSELKRNGTKQIVIRRPKP